MWFNFLSNKIIDLMILTCVYSHHPAKVIISPLGEKDMLASNWKEIPKYPKFSKRNNVPQKKIGKKLKNWWFLLYVTLCCPKHCSFFRKSFSFFRFRDWPEHDHKIVKLIRRSKTSKKNARSKQWRLSGGTVTVRLPNLDVKFAYVSTRKLCKGKWFSSTKFPKKITGPGSEFSTERRTNVPCFLDISHPSSMWHCTGELKITVWLVMFSVLTQIWLMVL